MEVEQLPRGRHRLTREQVTTSQRERMLVAMADAVAELGYAKTSVAEVIRRAGVSPRRSTSSSRTRRTRSSRRTTGRRRSWRQMRDELGQLFNRTSVSVYDKVDAILTRYLEALASSPRWTRRSWWRSTPPARKRSRAAWRCSSGSST